MVQNSVIFYVSKILISSIGSIIYFPLWWYGKGLVNLALKLIDFIISKEKALSLWVWIKNIHKPMYGQYDWQGILISLLVRIFQIIIRSIILLFWILLSLVIMAIWLALPPLVFIEILFQWGLI